MSEAPSNPASQSVQGTLNAAASDHSTAIVNVYGQPVQATPVTPEALASMRARLAELPLDTIPPVTPIPIGSRLKYSPNACFVGREVGLKKLAGHLKEGKTVIATGMGGIGKTQIAVEFAHRYGAYFPGGVFWLSFDNPDNVPNEIAECGYGMNLRPDYSSLMLEDKVRTARSAWASATPRLLIFDNCEDEALLRAFRPVSTGASVLVTSQREEWDRSLGVEMVPLGILSSDESVALLRKLNPELAQQADGTLREIGAEVDHLPLALHLVGSYLYTYRRVMNSEQVLDELRHYEGLEQKALQGEYGPSPVTLPTEHERNVWRTFQMSYAKLDPAQAVNELARQLLTCAACFAPGEPFSHELLVGAVLSETPTHDDRLHVEDALARLTSVGLLETLSQELYAYRLHRLIAKYVWAVSHNGLARAREGVERIVLLQAQEANKSGLVKQTAGWLVHLRYVTDKAIQTESERAADLCNMLGCHLQHIADYAGAKSHYEKALAIDEAAFGSQHPKVASDANNLGSVLRDIGNYARAKECHEQALVVDEAVFGSWHIEVAISANFLGMVLRDMADYAGAKACCEKALAIAETIPNLNNSHMAAIANNLGAVLLDLGDHAGAKAHFEQALIVDKATFGPLHPDVARDINNLGTVLQDMGNYAEAKTCYEQALAIDEAVFGAQHPKVAIRTNNLGSVLQDMGNYTEAKVRFEEALTIDKAVFGAQHPDIARDINNLGSVLQAMGNYAEAKAHFEQALVIAKATLGPQHPKVATTNSNLGILLHRMGNNVGAKACLEQALSIDKEAFGRQHPDVARDVHNLGSVLEDTGDYIGAKAYFEQALAIDEAIFGPQHLRVAAHANSLGVVLHTMGNYAEAKKRFRQALKILEHKFGQEHPNIDVVRNNLNALQMQTFLIGMSRKL